MKVYLDTSFISRYSQSHSLFQDAIASINPKLTLVTSSSHLIEALPKDEFDISKSIDRIKFLANKEFCVPVVPFNNLFDREIEAGTALNFSDIECPWEHLITDRISEAINEDFASQFRSKLKQKIKNKLSEIKDRKRREELKNRFLLHGEPRLQLIEADLEKNRIQLLQETQSTFPELSLLYESGGIFDVVLKKISSDDFSARLWKVLMSPVVMAKLSLEEEYRLDLKPVSHYYWMQHDKITKMVADQVQNATNLQFNSGLSHKHVVQEMSDHFRSDAFYFDIMKGLNGKATHSTISTARGTKNFLGVISTIIMDKIKAHSNIDSPKTSSEVKVKRSDLADAIHTMYQPYVDVFCCDNPTKRKLAEFGNFSDNICTSDEDLFRRIRFHSNA